MGYCKTKGFLTSAEDRAVRIQCRKTIYINVRKTIFTKKIRLREPVEFPSPDV